MCEKIPLAGNIVAEQMGVAPRVFEMGRYYAEKRVEQINEVWRILDEVLGLNSPTRQDLEKIEKMMRELEKEHGGTLTDGEYKAMLEFTMFFGIINEDDMVNTYNNCKMEIRGESAHIM